jgi:DNA-binding MarR family transcriptional regulator
MGDGDLAPRQHAVLVAVSQNEGLSQTNLVEKTGVDRSTLADIVRRMLKKGLLQRRRHEGRCTRLCGQAHKRGLAYPQGGRQAGQAG